MRGLEGSPFAASAVAFVFAGCLGVGTAKAADLGGDCCADLEDRITQLEATTVQKGNKKVTVTLYGRVNRSPILQVSFVLRQIEKQVSY